MEPHHRTLRRGKHRLLLWPGREADGSVETNTPSKVDTRDEMGRLEKLVKKYERGDLPKSEWLDKLAFRKMEEIHAVSLYMHFDDFRNTEITRPKRKSRKICSSTLTFLDSTFQSFSASL